MSTVNGTLPAHSNLLHYQSIFGAAFYNDAAVHMVSPPMYS